jgi:hypothetical protein
MTRFLHLEVVRQINPYQTSSLIYLLKINLTLTSLNTLFCFFEQEVLLTIVHSSTRRNNVVLPRFFARSPDRRSGCAVGSPRMLGRGRSVSPLRCASERSEGDANTAILTLGGFAPSDAETAKMLGFHCSRVPCSDHGC